MIHPDIPRELLPWLLYQNALTPKLRLESEEAELSILKQQWIPLGWWHRFFLKLDSGAIFQREIIMSSHNKACWYARTVIPELTYQTHESLFRRLQEVSLGEIIFNNARIVRAAFSIYAIHAGCIEYYWLGTAAPVVWARLSRFLVESSPFFLLEILLPGLLEVLGFGQTAL